VAAIIVLVLVGAAAVVFFSIGTTGPSNGSTNSSSAIQAAVVRPSGGLTITDMFGDINAAGLQAPSSNSSSVADQNTYKGQAGETFPVVFDIVYSLCAGRCPSQVVAVIALTPGFSIVSTTPTMPVPVVPTIGVQMECQFTVMVKAPSTPYNGTLTLVAQAG